MMDERLGAREDAAKWDVTEALYVLGQARGNTRRKLGQKNPAAPQTFAGFDGFLSKPLDPDRFPEQIRRVLSGEAVWEIH